MRYIYVLSVLFLFTGGVFARSYNFEYKVSAVRKFDKRGKSLSGFAPPNYNTTLYFEYAYNRSWRHFANLDIQTLVPINRNFEWDFRFQASAHNFYTFGSTLRPKFVLPVGEIFINADILYRAMVVYHQHDAVLGLALGYRMPYFSLNIGWYGRTMSFFKKYRTVGDAYVAEPVNISYRLEVFIRPLYSRWNVSACVASYDDYNFERMWQMLFMLNGYVNLNKHWSIRYGFECKPTGMFHLNASFYGMVFRLGYTYIF